MSPHPSQRLTIGSRSNPPTCSLHLLSFICGTLLGGAACRCLVAPYKYKHTNIHTYTYVDWKKKQNMKSCSTLSLWLTCKKKTWQGNPHLFSLLVFLPSLSLSPSRLLLSVGDLTRLAPLKNGFPRIFSFLFSIPCYNIFTPNFILGNLINHVVAGTPESAWLETKLSAIFALIIWF